MFLGRRYNAEEALAMGIVHKVLPTESLEGFVTDVLQNLVDNAPLSIANSKTIIEEYVKSLGTPDAARMRSAIERCAAKTTARAGAHSWRSASRASPADEDSLDSRAR